MLNSLNIQPNNLRPQSGNGRGLYLSNREFGLQV